MTMELPEIKLRAIGTVKSEIKKRGRDDVRDVVAEMVINPDLTEALDDLEDFSHIIVIYYIHKSRQPFPMKVRPRHGTVPIPVGVFASRSPDRPNPIGKTTVELLERRGNILKVRGLDAIDGTPIIDIKPYIPGIDAVKGARVPRWMAKR
jgi:tRNA-Thr(GGU) m(6)t(6)A37 methyltransferase TsaA